MAFKQPAPFTINPRFGDLVVFIFVDHSRATPKPLS
jgi:hypothetical protein